MLKRRKSTQSGHDRFGVRLGLFYAAIFLVIGSHMPFFPVWLRWRGLGSAEIAMIMAAPLLVRIAFTPAITFLSDHIGSRRTILIAGTWISAACLLLLNLTHGFWSILAVALVFALGWMPVMPLTEAIAMGGVRRHGLDYGRMRLWGSASFILATIGGGALLEQLAPNAVLWMLIAATIFTALVSHALPREPVRGVEGTLARVRLGDALRLAGSHRFLIFLLAVSLTQATHAIYYVFGTLNWQAQGLRTDIIGLLWATGVLAEILLFTWSGRIVRRFGPARLILIAALAAIVRWAVTALDPPLALLFAVQAGHALTFGAAHLGAIHFIAAAVPPHYAATAQGLHAAFSMGLVMGGVMMVSGPLYEGFGGAAYGVMAIMAVFAAGFALLLMRVWQGDMLMGGHPQSAGSGGSTSAPR